MLDYRPELLTKLSDDVLVIDKLLNYNISNNFVSSRFESEIIAKKLNSNNYKIKDFNRGEI